MMEVHLTALSMIIAIVLNLIPGEMRTCKVTGPEDEGPVLLTKQADGGWTMAVEIAEGRKAEPCTLRVDGTRLTVEERGEKQTVELADHLGIDEDTDWSKLETIEIPDGSIAIGRRPDGLDLVFKAGKDHKRQEIPVRVRWGKEEKE